MKRCSWEHKPCALSSVLAVKVKGQVTVRDITSCRAITNVHYT